MPTEYASPKHRVAQGLRELSETLGPSEQEALYELILRAEGLRDHRTLANLPQEALFSPEERRLIAELDAQPDPDVVLPRHPSLIVKPTRLCNLRCTYCNAWREGPDQNMSFEVLARMTHGVLRAPREPGPPGVLDASTTTFVWHGGEPMLRDVRFFLQALWLQHHWLPEGRFVANDMQTNASRVTQGFLDLCRSFHISVSVSLDGPPDIHDARRLDAAGRPTFERVREGIRLLQAEGLGHAVLMVIDEDIIERGPQALLDYVRSLGVRNVGLLNLVPGNDENGIDGNGAWLHWARYVAFLRDLFQLWYPTYRHEFGIRELDEPLRIMAGEEPGLCIYQQDCFKIAFDVDPDGTVTGCDKYVGDPAFRYGSLLDAPVSEVLTNALVQVQRDRDRRDTDELRACRWFHVCQGGCPHDRDVNRTMGLTGTDGCCGLGPLLDDIDEVVEHSTLADSAIDAAFGRPAPHHSNAVQAVPVALRR
ncbi:MAG: radical SAM protein [Acidimicrobiales bacterium]|nr:radical SAM protein [Acidimicrobiales bacterium]